MISKNILKNSKKLFSLDGKVALITGASRGLGKAISIGFASSGAKVILISRSKKEISNTSSYLNANGFKSQYFSLDINNRIDLNEAINNSSKKFGTIDILVNCAGITSGHLSENYPEDIWDKTLETNLKSAFFLSQIVAKNIIEKGCGGSIINITSIASVLASPSNPAYNASKGGLKLLTKALAADWAKYNIRVNNLAPGYFNTEINKKSWNDKKLQRIRAERSLMNRWGSPEEIVGPAIFLASEASSFITGQDLYVDGGFLAKSL